MNEIKISTKVQEGKNSTMSLKMNLEDLGVNWKEGEIIRVISHKNDGTLVLKRVGKKSSKTVAHKLTKTGGGKFSNNVGIYLSHGKRRFKDEFAKVDSISAACRFMDAAKTKLEVYMPKELFQVAKAV